MKATAIICEYNPFHNGHKYHIEETRQKCNSDYIIGIMSGPFTQRGTPAIVNKYKRAETALNNGCDIIIEIPVRYATSSAEGFAYGAAGIVKATGIVNEICFGIESGSLSELMLISDIIDKEPDAYRSILQAQLKSGFSYPVARTSALKTYLEASGSSFDIDISQPNTILALEYLRACKDLELNTHTIKRTDAGYHNISLSDNPDGMCSASAIRHNVQAGMNIDNYIPYNASDFLSYPLYENDFSLQLYMALINNINHPEEYLDMPNDLTLRIQNNITKYENWTQFMTLLKTKQYTYSRIQRALCHCMLGIKELPKSKTKTDMYKAPYIRVLGFRKSASALMKELNQSSVLPVITKPRDVHSLSDSFARKLLQEDITAAEIYETAFSYTHHKEKKYNEFTRGMIITE